MLSCHGIYSKQTFAHWVLCFWGLWLSLNRCGLLNKWVLIEDRYVVGGPKGRSELVAILLYNSTFVEEGQRYITTTNRMKQQSLGDRQTF